MKIKMLIYVVAVYFIVLLQSTLINYIAIFNVKPNLVVIFIVSIALLRGNVEGACLGFFAGLTQDMLSGKAVGPFALMGMYTGLIIGSVNRRLYRENFLVCIFFTFITSMVYEFIVFVPTLMITGYQELLFVLKGVIVPEAVYNSVLSILIYILAIRIHHKFEEIDKSARKY